MQNGQTASYDIVRGGSVIGSQTVHYTQAGPDLTVDITVNAAIRVLGVRVYNYVHRGTEHWHDGQMVGLVAKTDDDGVPRQVNATRDPATGWHGVSGPSPGMVPVARQQPVEQPDHLRHPPAGPGDRRDPGSYG